MIEDALLLLTLVMSPSLLMTRTVSSCDDVLLLIFVVVVVPVTESVNIFGVREPVRDLVTILLVSVVAATVINRYQHQRCVMKNNF